MATLDFLPFEDGDPLTAADLNSLVQSIMDGTIFSATATGVVPGIITPLSTSVLTLQAQVAQLETFVQLVSYREQFAMTAGQSTIGLSQIPVLDSELVYLNGISLAKSGLPPGSTYDYTISGSVITLDPAVSVAILATDVIEVVYQSEA